MRPPRSAISAVALSTIIPRIGSLAHACRAFLQERGRGRRCWLMLLRVVAARAMTVCSKSSLIRIKVDFRASGIFRRIAGTLLRGDCQAG